MKAKALQWVCNNHKQLFYPGMQRSQTTFFSNYQNYVSIAKTMIA